MSLKYRKRVKILPGVTLNFSKSGVSTTIGTKGLSVNFGKKGTYLNTGIPGTGLYDRKRISGPLQNTPPNNGQLPPINSEPQKMKPGCVSIILLILGIGCLALAIYCFIIKAEAGQFIGLFNGILFITPFLNFYIKRNSKTNASGATASGCLSGLLYTFGMMSTGFGLEMYKENDLGFKLLIAGIAMLFLALIFHIIAIKKSKSISSSNSDNSHNDINDSHIVTKINGTSSFIIDSLPTAFNDIFNNINSINKRVRTKVTHLTNRDILRIPDSLYNDIVTSVTMLYLYLQATGNNKKATEALDSVIGLDQCKIINFTIDSRIAVIALRDLLVCYDNLGYDVNAERAESIAIILFVIKIISPDPKLTITQDLLLGYYKKIVNEFIAKFKESFKCFVPEDKLFLSELFKSRNVDNNVTNRYLTLLYELLSSLSKIDGRISVKESSFLTVILQGIGDLSNAGKNEAKSETVTIFNRENDRKPALQNKNTSTKPEKELEELIGLESVKEEVKRLTNFVKVQQMRKDRGLTSSPMSYHCVFTGNPGTGKTTVARILAKIYSNLGILAKGHLIETDRSGLVAEYVGQTAVKTNRIIDTAIGGVLFIDEAYSLVQGGNNDYGKEAISTLLKRMEDNRDKLIVILAGYGNEMKTFIDSNPGLQSRFSRYINFPDYSAENLMEILKINIKKYEYTLDDKASELLGELFRDAVKHKDNNFGNGRFARNVLEKILENQATRLTLKTDISEEDLCMIIDEDVPNFEELK